MGMNDVWDKASQDACKVAAANLRLALAALNSELTVCAQHGLRVDLDWMDVTVVGDAAPRIFIHADISKVFKV